MSATLIEEYSGFELYEIKPSPYNKSMPYGFLIPFYQADSKDTDNKIAVGYLHTDGQFRETTIGANHQTYTGYHHSLDSARAAIDQFIANPVPVKGSSRVKQWIIARQQYERLDGTLFKLRTGKIAAQVAHASVNALHPLLSEPTRRVGSSRLTIGTLLHFWLNGDHTKIVLKATTQEDLDSVFNEARERDLPCSYIIDKGYTEFHGIPTPTAVAVGPCLEEDVDFLSNFSLL